LLLYLNFIKFVTAGCSLSHVILLLHLQVKTGRQTEIQRDTESYTDRERERPDVSRSRGQTIVVSMPSAVLLACTDIPHTMPVLWRRASQHRQHHCQSRPQLTLMNLWHTVRPHGINYNVTGYVTRIHPHAHSQPSWQPFQRQFSD